MITVIAVNLHHLLLWALAQRGADSIAWTAAYFLLGQLYRCVTSQALGLSVAPDSISNNKQRRAPGERHKLQCNGLFVTTAVATDNTDVQTEGESGEF